MTMTPSEYGQLYTSYKDRLVVIALSYLRSRSEAEDVVEEAFARFWEKREQLEASVHPEAYLLSMVKNRCLNHLRDRATHQRAQQNIQEEAMRAMQADIDALSDSTASSHSIDEDVRNTLHSLLDNLPPLRREIIRLVKFEDLTYNQAALRLGISPRKVKKEVHRVLCGLRDIITSRPWEG